MKRVLLATDVPFWLRQKGNQQRIAELARFLAVRNSLTVFYLGEDMPDPGIAGVRLITANPHRGLMALAWRIFRRAPGRLQQALVTALNRLRYRRPLASFRNADLLARFSAECRAGDYDAVIIEYIWYAYLAAGVDRARTRTILDIHDIFHRRVEEYARFGRVPDKTVTRDEELEVYGRFDYLLAIQQTEYAWLGSLFPADRVLLAMHPVAPVPGRYAERLASLPGGRRLNIVYFASFGDVNLDAIDWFAASVWDAALAERFELHIHGAICDSVQARAPGITVHGRASRVADAYRDADIVINPARFGTGLKIKTVEAIAHGVPVVTTPIGAEGLPAGADRFLMIATDPASFRRQLTRLEDPGLRRTLSAAGLEFVARELTPAACFDPLQGVIDAAN